MKIDLTYDRAAVIVALFMIVAGIHTATRQSSERASSALSKVEQISQSNDRIVEAQSRLDDRLSAIDERTRSTDRDIDKISSQIESLKIMIMAMGGKSVQLIMHNEQAGIKSTRNGVPPPAKKK